MTSAAEPCHRGLNEVKKVYQDVLFKAADLSKGEVRIENNFAYTPLSEYILYWTFQRNGREVSGGERVLSIAPGASAVETFPLPECVDGDCTLTLSLRTASAKGLLPEDFEIAREQFILSELSDFSHLASDFLPASASSVSHRVDGKVHIISSAALSLRFDASNGNLLSLTSDGRTLLQSGPEPSFWRAPTDNDWGNGAHIRCNQWRCASQNRTLKSFDVAETDGGVQVRVVWHLEDVYSDYEMVYTVLASGAVRVSASWTGHSGLGEMLRFGQGMVLPSVFGNVSWYGRGPWENYSDRNTASFLGLWSASVQDMFFPYVRPQESGNRTDVRWVTLTDGDGFGLAVVAEDKALNFTAVDIDMASVDPGLSKGQRHIDDIHHDRTRIWLNVDLGQRGLGGDDSWGRPPHKPYILDARHYEYSYLLIPIR